MSRRTTRLLQTALRTMHWTGADGILSPITRGAGVIFMLHQVLPGAPDAFAPNRILKVTPDFLDEVITRVSEQGFDVISLDEAHDRMTEGDYDRPFACFTLDDGYKDNRDHALPVFEKHGAPFTIYVPADYADGRGELWWLALEDIISRNSTISLNMNGDVRHFDCDTVAQKDKAFHVIYWWLRGLDEDEARSVVDRMYREVGGSMHGLSRELVMGWDELRDIARHPLVTIGAHTRSHYALAKLPASIAKAQMAESIVRIERELGLPCRHFSYPYGDETSAGEREFRLAKELGMKTAVTTRKGLIQKSATANLTGLPRLSLNGDYQDWKYVKVLLNGLPFALQDMAGRMRALTGRRRAA